MVSFVGYETFERYFKILILRLGGATTFEVIIFLYRMNLTLKFKFKLSFRVIIPLLHSAALHPCLDE